jgi:hypothetical protein
VQRTCQARACASQSRGCTHVGAGARQDIARARGGGGEHSSGGSRPSTRPPTRQHKRHAHAGAAGATGQPARGRHAPRCAAADARSVGRGSGLAALPRPSQSRPEKGRLIFQNRDAMGGAAPRPSTRTMVLCTGTRGSRVRCAPRKRRPAEQLVVRCAGPADASAGGILKSAMAALTAFMSCGSRARLVSAARRSNWW